MSETTMNQATEAALSGEGFNPIRYAKRLKDAGLDAEVADVIADEQTQLVNTHLATKRDLAELELRLKHAIGETVAQAKVEILRWSIGFSVGQTLLILGAIAFIR